MIRVIVGERGGAGKGPARRRQRAPTSRKREGGGGWPAYVSILMLYTQFHIQLLWVLLWSTVMGLILQVRKSKTPKISSG
jgi:hypothetical protein